MKERDFGRLSQYGEEEHYTYKSKRAKVDNTFRSDSSEDVFVPLGRPRFTQHKESSPPILDNMNGREFGDLLSDHGFESSRKGHIGTKRTSKQDFLTKKGDYL